MIHSAVVDSFVRRMVLRLVFSVIDIRIVGRVLMLRMVRGLMAFMRAMILMSGVILLLLRLRMLTVTLMPRMVLRGGGCGDEGRCCQEKRAHHASPSGKGRTVTVCIIPACMW